VENIRKALKYIKKQWERLEKETQKIIVAVVVYAAIIGVTALLIFGTDKNGEKKPTNGKPVVDITGKEEQEEEQEDDKNVISKEDQEAAKVPPVEEGDPYADIQSQKDKEKGPSANIKDVIKNAKTDQITHGIDVSKYQGTINWKEVKKSGVQFAMIRVGYRTMVSGEIKEDNYAKKNIQEATKNGIKVGVYFFSAAVTEKEAIEEAEWVLEFIKGYKITYPVVYDCEGYKDDSNRHANISEVRRTDNALAFMNKIAEGGYSPMFYSSQSDLEDGYYWETHRISSIYSVWLAYYPSKPYPETEAPKYSGEYAMWQYTNKGVVPGIGTKVDMNVAYFGFEGTETPEDIPDPTPDVNPEISPTVKPEVTPSVTMQFETKNEQVTAKDQTNLRDKPSQGSDSQVLHTLLNGQVAKRTGINTATGWSRVEYNGKTYYAVSSFLTTDLNYKKPEEQPSNIKTQFQNVNEQMTAKEKINLRNIPSVTDENSQVVATITAGQVVTRTGINTDVGWSRVVYNGQTLYCVSSYLKPVTTTEQNETQ